MNLVKSSPLARMIFSEFYENKWKIYISAIKPGLKILNDIRCLVTFGLIYYFNNQSKLMRPYMNISIHIYRGSVL